MSPAQQQQHKPATSVEAPDDSPYALDLADVGMTFTGRNGVATEAIASVSGCVHVGRFVSLIGPSGCGKSSLLDIVSGLVRPTSGTVKIGGATVEGLYPDMAMVFQGDSTLHWRTVLHNVALGLEIAGRPREERLAAAQAMIDLVGLTGFENHRPRQLSGGMRQRVAIARALVMEPRILLMDEPFGSLDQQTRILLGEELTRIWQASRPSVLFVTHDIQEAALLSDEVWVMSQRPARIKAVVPVELDRPRVADVVNTPAFHELTGRLWDLIRDEARRAMDTDAP